MNPFVRHRLRHTREAITLAYVIAAFVLGLHGEWVAALVGADVSPMASASAVAILSAIAAGMMALTAIGFSLLIVAVQHGSTAYSPRVFRVLGSGAFAAHALGIFTGTFVYALLAIRAVDLAGGTGINAPVVWLALFWLVASVGTLIRLLPRISSFTLGDVLVALQRRGSAAAMRVYPREAVGSDVRAEPPRDRAVTQALVHDRRPMYVVGLDVERLVRQAADANALVVVLLAIGDSVIAGDQLAIVHGATRPLADRALRDAIWLANERNVDNDPTYAIRLLVDIAIRALSPAVNDPTTAVAVLDQLDGLLRVLGTRSLEANQVADAHGVVRLIRATVTWDDLVALALTEIHHYGRESHQVERRLATLLRNLPAVLPEHRRGAIERFDRWRMQTWATVIDDAQGWLDPLAPDRQGIGHGGNGWRCP